MPRSKTNKKRDKPPKENVISAMDMITKQGYAIRRAAVICQIPKSTLSQLLAQHKKSGNEEFVYNEKSNCTKQVFSPEQEQSLRDYIDYAAKIHFGLTVEEVKKLAYEFAKSKNIEYPKTWDENKMAGKTWYYNFIAKNKLSLRKPQATSMSRSIAFNKHNVGVFFEKLETVFSRGKFTADRIVNLDETGISTVHVPAKVLATTGTKQLGSVTSGERGVLTTMIAAIDAMGLSIPPMLIFPRVNFKDNMMIGAPPGAIGAANQSGWSNAEKFVLFLQHIIKFKSASKQNELLIIMDNHESHISLPALTIAKDNGVTLLSFPPHTSHKLQPLDRTVFGPFKKFYNKASTSWMLQNPGKQITIYNIAKLVGEAYPLAFTPSNIASGFRVTGIWPFNDEIFSEADFLGSFVTDQPEDGPENLSSDQQSTKSVPDQPSQALPLNQQPSTSASGEESSTSKSDLQLPPTLSDLENIRPFRKAAPRKKKTGGRKAGKCRIFTDTPEKKEIEEEHNKKALKKLKPVKKKLLTEANNGKDKNQNEEEQPAKKAKITSSRSLRPKKTSKVGK